MVYPPFFTVSMIEFFFPRAGGGTAVGSCWSFLYRLFVCAVRLCACIPQNIYRPPSFMYIINAKAKIKHNGIVW